MQSLYAPVSQNIVETHIYTSVGIDEKLCKLQEMHEL
jgi:hypothetical protein